MFKKRQMKKSGGLRRKRTIDAAEEQEEDNEDQLQLIRELREEQKERKKIAGISTDKLLVSDAAKAAKAARKEEEEKQSAAEVDGGADLKNLITNQFTEQVGSHTIDDHVHEKRMEEFINERLGKKPAGDEDEKAAEAVPQSKREEDALYQIPELAPEAVGGASVEGGTGHAAPLFMNTGIAEVNLPMRFRLKNIEDTDKLRAKMDGERPTRRPQESGSGLPTGSFNSNYNHHRREHAMMMKGKGPLHERQRGSGMGGEGGGRGGGRGGGHHGRGGGGGGRGGGGQVREASDDMVYERYKKRARNFRR